MPLAQNKAITIAPKWPRRIEAQKGIVQDAQDFHQRKGRPYVAPAIHFDHLHDQPAKLLRSLIKWVHHQCRIPANKPE
jgi:hypothetical protein